MNLTRVNVKCFIEPNENAAVVKGSFDFYHYNCDGVNDEGWGCGYRTLQSMCSWFKYNMNFTNVPIPTLLEIQKILVKMEDKPTTFLNSKEWIGSVEVGLVIDELFNIPCKILHTKSVAHLNNRIDDIYKHFLEKGCPIMMGGDMDCSSKGIVGVRKIDETVYLLIVDPHCREKNQSQTQLQNKEWISWHSIQSLSNNSFYNLCLPQIKC